MRENHDPSKGISNMDLMYRAIGAEHVQINSIRIRPTSPSQQEFGMTEIEELPQSEDEQEITEEENHGVVNVKPIKVNKVPVGEACSPYEVI